MIISIQKHDAQGIFVWSYDGHQTQRTTTMLAIEAIFQREDMDLGFTIFKKGDRFVEYFYADRWYNIFAVYDRDDTQLKGWYCNVCRPATLNGTSVVYDDLALDLWVHANGTWLVLDEDEFAELNLPATDANQAQLALQQLQALAQTGQLPR